MSLIVALVFVVILIKIIAKLTCGRCKSHVCLVGKTALITGGNTGMGFQTALALAGRGCRVIIADKNDCTKSKEEIIRKTGNTNIITKKFDLASFKSVRQLAQDINETEERLDILINNAAVAGIGSAYAKDGLYIGMQVNHFGPFLLTHLLIGLLKKSSPSRIIFVSSAAAHLVFKRQLFFLEHVPANIFFEWLAYSNSKLCNIITANILAKKLEGTGVTVNSLHPGVADTQIITNYFANISSQNWLDDLIWFFTCFFKLFTKTAEEGAQTTIHLAMAKEVESITGKYFVDCKVGFMPHQAKNLTYAKEVWEASEKFVQLTSEEKL